MKHSSKPAVLITHVGDDANQMMTHDDYSTNLAKLREFQDIDVVEANLVTDYLPTIFANNNICAVDTHHTRLWQKRWSDYQPRLEQLQSLCDDAGAIMINDLSMFVWNLDKASYLMEMKTNGLPVIPTEVVPTTSKDFTLSTHVAQTPSGVVIKPSSGMRASGIAFIQQQGSDYIINQPTTPDDAIGAERATVQTQKLNETSLNEWFHCYLADSQQEKILIQELIQTRQEVSVVKLKGQQPYGILRTEGKATQVAHEAFGGRNIPLASLPDCLSEFAHAALKSMPAHIADQYIHRIDVLITPDHGGKPGVFLLEVESAGPRLFIPEAQQFESFPRMMRNTALGSQSIKTQASNITVAEHLAHILEKDILKASQQLTTIEDRELGSAA